jgi:NAD(P) transhydrogenase subunit alpha
VVPSRAEVFGEADVIAQVRACGAAGEAGRADVPQLRDGQMLVAVCDALWQPRPLAEFAGRKVAVYSLEMMPRTTRAQSMDVLSSMATISGYKAVILAAASLRKMFPMMMTAAGTVQAAKVFVIGAGVAGLQAISTARRLGAVVQGYDIRPAAQEQIESVGGKFVNLGLETKNSEGTGGYARAMNEEFYRRQREGMARVVAASDVVITAAVVLGQKAPLLVTAEMVAAMSPGSIVMDLAAERGGNCEATRPDETVVRNGVTILGPTNLPSTVPQHASEMFSRNVTAFLLHVFKDGRPQFDADDEILRETLVARGGEIVHPRVQELLS